MGPSAPRAARRSCHGRLRLRRAARTRRRVRASRHSMHSGEMKRWRNSTTTWLLAALASSTMTRLAERHQAAQRRPGGVSVGYGVEDSLTAQRVELRQELV
jgi:hypothetical protein